MERDIATELQRFEGLRSGFARFEVLAWRTIERVQKPSAILLPRDRLDIALLWGRTSLPTQWALVQCFRRWAGEDNRWHRSLAWRELVRPLERPRPGEDRDGSWHAYARYDHAPSSREICRFAQVSFLNVTEERDFRAVSAGFRITTWLAVAGSEPACRMRPSQ